LKLIGEKSTTMSLKTKGFKIFFQLNTWLEPSKDHVSKRKYERGWKDGVSKCNLSNEKSSA
jgi:hypothetical protein